MATDRTEPIVELKGVSKSFSAPTGGPAETIPVLRDISLAIAPGDTISLVGPSGSGKSTLLHLIGTLDQPSAGEVLLKGRSIAGLDEAGLAELRAREVGFVFQQHYLLPQCTVLENVLVPTLALRNQPPAEELAEARGRRLLERVGLVGRWNHLPGQLSGGERQRAAVVRALINSPSLLLADEPTGALDQESAQRLAELLVELNREECVTLVVATHSPELAARMRQGYTLRQGRLTSADL